LIPLLFFFFQTHTFLYHQDLHHGVRVFDQRDDGGPAERWSWIMWFRDSDTCEDHEPDWYHQCSEDGNPTCMYLRATHEKSNEDVVLWNQKASDAGKRVFNSSYYIILYCIVLYCIILYYIVLYCILLYSIVFYCILLYRIVSYRIV
jgi:hypothetical protein